MYLHSVPLKCTLKVYSRTVLSNRTLELYCPTVLYWKKVNRKRIDKNKFQYASIVVVLVVALHEAEEKEVVVVVLLMVL